MTNHTLTMSHGFGPSVVCAEVLVSAGDDIAVELAKVAYTATRKYRGKFDTIQINRMPHRGDATKWWMDMETRA